MRHYQSTQNFSAAKNRKFYVYGFLALTVIIMLFSRIYSAPLDYVSGHIQNTSAPIINTLSKPVSAVKTTFGRASEMMQLQDELTRLQQENISLRSTQTKLMQLQGQNNALRALLNFVATPGSTWITTSVISDVGGTFSRALIIDAGEGDNLQKGQAVLTGEGLIGRVAQVNNDTAIVLLLTDINSSIPVMVEHTKDRALLTGNNSDIAELRHLAENAQIQPGAQLVTSGSNGSLPVGIPVGTVTAIADGKIFVRPAVGMHDIEVVRVITENSQIAKIDDTNTPLSISPENTEVTD